MTKTQPKQHPTKVRARGDELYAGAMMAMTNAPDGALDVRMKAIYVYEAPDAETAKQGILDVCLKRFPRSEGWFNHTADVMLIPVEHRTTPPHLDD